MRSINDLSKSRRVPKQYSVRNAALLCAAALALIALPHTANADGKAGSDPSSTPRYHTVEKGEYLSDVARTFGVSIKDLVTANHLASSNHITTGLRLLIPAASPVAAPASPALPSADPAAQRQGFRTERRLTLTFSSLDVRVIMDQISNYAHVDVLLTPGAKGIVSVNIRNRSADDAIRLVTAVAGLSVVKVGSAYVVGPAEEVAKAAGEFGQVEVIPLHFITPEEAVAGLGRLAPHVSVLPTKGGIIITGLAEDITLAHSVLASLDVAAPPAPAAPNESRIVTLQHAAPASAARVINEAYPDVKVSAQDRTLILVGAPLTLDAAGRALQALDVEAPVLPEATEVLVYRLKYLNAKTSEESIKKAFPKVTVTVAPEPAAPPAAVFNPLNSIFGGSSESSTGSSSGSGTSSSSSGGSSGSTGATGGAGGAGGATPQILSRPTRLILVGAKSDVAAARTALEESDVAQPTVRIEAVMVEIDRTDTQNLGILWDFTNTSLTFTEPAGSNVTFGTLQRSPASFNTTLQALFTQNKAKILASPNISVVDNEDASIFIGDTITYLGGTTSSPVIGTVQNVQSLAVGVALLMRPRIHPDGSVTLKVHPVISSLTGFTDNLPQTSNREADTTVLLKEGEEFVIGGLDRTDITTSVNNKVPILGDIPILKEFFTSRSHTTAKTEVMILLRAYPIVSEPAPTHDFHYGEQK